MSVTHETLVEQIVEQIELLPENLAREVLDFAGYLRIKYDDSTTTETDKSFLATFGSWKDDRNSEEIIRDIYTHRTVSEVEYDL